MNKADLINALTETMSEEHGLAVRKAHTEAFLDSLASVTTQALSADEEITLPGLGKFSVTNRAERQGRNPQNGAPITIPAAKVPKFAPSKALKDALNP